MRIKIIGLAFAIALLAMIGFAYYGTSNTAEAAIHPIVQSACAAEDVEVADPRNPPGQIGNPSTDDGMPNDDLNHPWLNSDDKAKSGEGTAHCTNPSPSD